MRYTNVTHNRDGEGFGCLKSDLICAAIFAWATLLRLCAAGRLSAVAC